MWRGCDRLREARGSCGFIDLCITQLKAQGPSRTCNESKEEEEEARGSCGFEFGVQGLGLGVQGCGRGIGVWDLGFEFWGLGNRLGCEEWGLGTHKSVILGAEQHPKLVSANHLGIQPRVG